MNKLKIIIGLLLVSAIGNAQGLQSYISEAQANNPKIQAYELRYTIAREKENEANWLPNTEFGAGYFVSEPETRTGAQVARFFRQTNAALVRDSCYTSKVRLCNGRNRLRGLCRCKAKIGTGRGPIVLRTL